MTKNKEEISKWINSSEGQKAFNDSHEVTKSVIADRKKATTWTLEEWISILLTPYR